MRVWLFTRWCAGGWSRRRCVYTLEYAFHANFKPWETQCRLSYDVIPNRAFYTAVFRHMQHVSRSGTRAGVLGEWVCGGLDTAPRVAGGWTTSVSLLSLVS